MIVTINKCIAKMIKKNNFKIVIGGDGAVGKTTLSERLVGTLKKEEDRLMTCGIEFHNLKVCEKNSLQG